MDSFYPRCYVVSKSKVKADPNNAFSDPMYDQDCFKDHFRTVWAESILKRYVQSGKMALPKILLALHINEKRMMGIDEIMEMYQTVDG